MRARSINCKTKFLFREPKPGALEEWRTVSRKKQPAVAARKVGPHTKLMVAVVRWKRLSKRLKLLKHLPMATKIKNRRHLVGIRLIRRWTTSYLISATRWSLIASIYCQTIKKTRRRNQFDWPKEMNRRISKLLRVLAASFTVTVAAAVAVTRSKWSPAVVLAALRLEIRWSITAASTANRWVPLLEPWLKSNSTVPSAIFRYLLFYCYSTFINTYYVWSGLSFP